MLLVAGSLALLVAATFRDLQRWSISAPLLGLVVGVLLGPRVLDVLTLGAGTEHEVLEVASRLLLAVALIAVALRFPLEVVRERVRELAVLLLVVLPVMAGVVAVGGHLLLGLPLGLALVLGAALSPTDPVISSGIVTGEAAERDIPDHPRQLLSLESGANDGLAMPLVLVAIGVVLGEPLAGRIGTAVYEVIGAVALGVVAGIAAGTLLRWAERRREIGTAERSLYTLVLAAAVLGSGGLLQVEELLSVFVAGLAHNALVSSGDRESEVELDEALNQFLVLPLFVLLGAALPWEAWGELGAAGGAGLVAVALLARRLPVVLLVRRPLRATWGEAAWLGWFGAIGVGPLYFLTFAHAEGVTDGRVWAAGTLVIAVSTVVHALTAGPSRVLYRRSEGPGEDEDADRSRSDRLPPVGPAGPG